MRIRAVYIAAVTPPNNAEISLLAVKRNLFKRSSALSSWALKPMIPFAFTEEQPEPVRRKNLPELPEGGLVVDSPSVMNKQYVIGSAACSEFCMRLEGMFSGCKGFRSGLHGLHMFDIRDNGISDFAAFRQATDNDLAELDKSVFIWKSCSISIFRLDTELFSAEKWWNRVILAAIYEIRFPRSRKQ